MPGATPATNSETISIRAFLSHREWIFKCVAASIMLSESLSLKSLFYANWNILDSWGWPSSFSSSSSSPVLVTLHTRAWGYREHCADQLIIRDKREMLGIVLLLVITDLWRQIASGAAFPGQAKSCWLEWDMREGAAWPPLHTAPNELRENSWDFILIRKVSLTLVSRYGCEAMIWKCVGCLRPILYIDSGDGLSRSPGHLIRLRHRLWRDFWVNLGPRTKLLKMLSNNAAHVFVAQFGSL